MRALILAAAIVAVLSGSASAEDYSDRAAPEASLGEGFITADSPFGSTQPSFMTEEQFRAFIWTKNKQQVIAIFGPPGHTTDWPGGIKSWFYEMGDQSHIYDADTRRLLTHLIISFDSFGEIHRISLSN